MVKSTNLRVLCSIISELRKTSSMPMKDNQVFQYLMQQYRKHATTEQQICKAHEELNFIAATYLCYLKSSRMQKEINQEFNGKGERSVKETAHMVGFKLPLDPK